jgi:hypothetical protein
MKTLKFVGWLLVMAFLVVSAMIVTLGAFVAWRIRENGLDATMEAYGVMIYVVPAALLCLALWAVGVEEVINLVEDYYRPEPVTAAPDEEETATGFIHADETFMVPAIMKSRRQFSPKYLPGA